MVVVVAVVAVTVVVDIAAVMVAVQSVMIMGAVMVAVQSVMVMLPKAVLCRGYGCGGLGDGSDCDCGHHSATWPQKAQCCSKRAAVILLYKEQITVRLCI
jgi:hypothetical protein